MRYGGIVLSCILAASMTGTAVYGQQQGSAPISNEPPTFLNRAIELSAAQVQLGNLAASKTLNDQVKAYAQMMVKDNLDVLEKFQQLQSPTPRHPVLNEEHQALKARLSGLNQSRFDREYIAAMINGHTAAIRMFEQQVGSDLISVPGGENSAVSALAREWLPVLRKHLEQAELVLKTL